MERDHMTPGIFYGVGVGPGDPELLTLQAVRLLERCPVIAAPQTRDGGMLALEIARQAVDLSGKIILPLHFSMSPDPEKRRQAHQAAGEEVRSYLEQGQDVAMLNLGDVSIYASYQYLMELLKAQGYETRMVPGVPSFCAVAAKLGMSLTEMDQPLQLLPGSGLTGESLREQLARPGTKVLMKSGRQLPKVLSTLEEMELLKRSAMVCDCGLPQEQVFLQIDRETLPEDMGYFTTIVVG